MATHLATQQTFSIKVRDLVDGQASLTSTSVVDKIIWCSVSYQQKFK